MKWLTQIWLMNPLYPKYFDIYISVDSIPVSAQRWTIYFSNFVIDTFPESPFIKRKDLLRNMLNLWTVCQWKNVLSEFRLSVKSSKVSNPHVQCCMQPVLYKILDFAVFIRIYHYSKEPCEYYSFSRAVLYASNFVPKFGFGCFCQN